MKLFSSIVGSSAVLMPLKYCVELYTTQRQSASEAI